MTLDPRLNAYRNDLADEQLRGQVHATRYAACQPAWVIAGRTAVRAKAKLIRQAEIVTYYHYGEELRVFEITEGIAWCQSLFDSYVGYVDARDIELGLAPAPTHYVATTACYAYEVPDLRSFSTGYMPRHSPVRAVKTGLVTRGTEYVQLGMSGYVPLACLAPEPPRSPDLVAAAELYLGCPYLWGGRSFLGIDCSGLVQAAFRDIGVTVLRDTDMQRDAIGEPVSPGSLDDLRRGDLLYLPGHVLIYAGAGAVIHADGATMTVGRDNLATLMRQRGLKLADFVVRRHSKAQER